MRVHRDMPCSMALSDPLVPPCTILLLPCAIMQDLPQYVLRLGCLNTPSPFSLISCHTTPISHTSVVALYDHTPAWHFCRTCNLCVCQEFLVPVHLIALMYVVILRSCHQADLLVFVDLLPLPIFSSFVVLPANNKTVLPLSSLSTLRLGRTTEGITATVYIW